MTNVPAFDTSFVAASLGDLLIEHTGPHVEFRRAVIDSREAADGDLFVALEGTRVDGHQYATAAVEHGAHGVLVREPVDLRPEIAMFIVSDPLAALQRIAVAWRSSLDRLQVVGVTGNVGKSTTKLITAALLQSRYRVQAEAQNYNNEIGVPLCLLRLRPETERAVIEMGMYTTGEIALLCEWTRPQIGIVLNVGPVHLERAGSLDVIARAKRELVESLPPDGHAILNVDDPRVRAMASHTRAQVWTVGTSPELDVRSSDLESRGADGFLFTLHALGRSRRVRVALPGAHLVTNVLASAAAALADGVEFDTVCESIERLDVPTRLTIRRSVRGFTVLDDTYNASPVATLAALDLLGETPGRRIAVLGDMLELGDLSAVEHERVGRRAAEVADVLLTVGSHASTMNEAASRAGLADTHHFASKEEIGAAVRALVAPGDVVLVKASRALALESVVAELLAPNASEGTAST
ncbi:MAG: UDP-N-acetylmuramoyl-tripeptide--D-alanyl-D-alanine ligase [Dehalococcoidia bacterium]